MRTIPVFYRPEQTAPPQVMSPSADKPRYVVESWLDARLPVEIRSFEPLSPDEIAIAHDRRFVDGILAGRIRNGFGNRSRGVARSLPFTTGSFVAAAREAIANQQVAVSPTSGFHHACYDSAGGFCTFNGLMIAAHTLLQQKIARWIAILDCDQHYGNGTDDILRRSKVASRHIVHFTRGSPNYMQKSSAADFLNYLPRALRLMRERFGAEILLYQAGADPHIADPLGGFLTTEEMRERDAIVFECCRELGLPVVWNLAGGYQTIPGVMTPREEIRPVLDLHDNTMRECVRVFVDKRHPE